MRLRGGNAGTKITVLMFGNLSTGLITTHEDVEKYRAYIINRKLLSKKIRRQVKSLQIGQLELSFIKQNNWRQNYETKYS